MGLSLLSSSLLTILVPKSIELGGSTALIILRLITGLGEGAMHPAVLRLMGRWIPEDERSWAGTWAFSGMSVGTVIGMAGSGIIMQRIDIGWPMVFYFFGGFGILSFFIHCVLCYDSPARHPFISKDEAKYLKDKLGEFYIRKIGSNSISIKRRYITVIRFLCVLFIIKGVFMDLCNSTA